MNIEEELFGIKKRIQAINSKLKGNKNEVQVTKVLQEWTGHEFARVPRSGGLRWKNRMDICGDVINVDSSFEFPFSVETKHVKSLGISRISKYSLRANSVIFTFFRQCQRDADASGKKPFLMVRYNGMPKGVYYIFLNMNGYEWNHMTQILKSDLHGMHVDDKYAIIGYNSEEFFWKVKYETFKNIMTYEPSTEVFFNKENSGECKT